MREGWEYKKLGEVAQVVSGATPKTNVDEFWGEGHYWVTPAELNDSIVYVERTERQITDLALLKTKLQLLPKGTVLLSSRAPIGKVAICGVDMYCNQGFKNCICSDAIYNKYLFYFLKGKKEYLNSLGRGATFKEISKSIVEKVIIPLPPMQEQKGIVAELDQINDLIRLKKEQLKEYDNLAQSIFYDMFGDPVENEKDWKVKPLGEFGFLGRGVSKHRPRNAPELLGGTMPLVQTGDVANSGMYLTKYNSTYSDLGVAQSKIWEKGTLCITIAATIGKCAILSFRACFPDSVVGFLCNEKVCNNVYMYFIFSCLQKILEEEAPAVAQKNINLKKLNSLMIPLPPLPLQQEFSTRIEQIEKLKTEVQKTITDLETLLASRMQYWFE